MEQQDDMAYLKRYVQNHPDNRMAWYLLGKQYVIEEKEAKANYCFLKAGSIYEAFERKQHPLANEPQQLIAQWNRHRRMKQLVIRS
ncbi:L,D-transpeptidase, partial [Paenibacillus sepulcri]|nr:L,D-transpeptidase [Paenibacillus sepulcri]